MAEWMLDNAFECQHGFVQDYNNCKYQHHEEYTECERWKRILVEKVYLKYLLNEYGVDCLWISVKEKLPVDMGTVLIAHGGEVCPLVGLTVHIWKKARPQSTDRSKQSPTGCRCRSRQRRYIMTNGWSHDFDLDSVPEGVMWSIRDNIKKWDDAHRVWSEEMLEKKREEVKRLEAEHNELVSSDKICAVSAPQYVKCIFCPCMNGGEGGFVNED